MLALPDLQAFVRVATSLSFAAAAKSLEMTPSAVSKAVARKLAATRHVLVASTEYLAVRGRPRTPEDLRAHDCLMFRSSTTGRPIAWRFRRRGKAERATPPARHVFDNSEALLGAARRGMGVAQLLDVTAAEPVARGELEAVLAGFSDVGPPVSAMFAKERGKLPGVRAFSDFLAEQFRGTPPWERTPA